MKIKKLNSRGFSHDIVLILIVVIVAIVGVAYLVGSHADPVPIGANLYENQQLYVNQSLTSPSGVYRAILQTDGNLCVYNGSSPTWCNYTQGKSSSSLAMQNDGNLCQYSKANAPIWCTYTNGRGGSRLTMQNDGNLVIYNTVTRPVWSIKSGMLPAPPNSTVLNNGQRLYPNQYLISPDGSQALLVQTDGNLVVYDMYGHDRWDTRTNGNALGFLYMQPDGNLVLYNKYNQALWASHTNGFGATAKLYEHDNSLEVSGAHNNWGFSF